MHNKNISYFFPFVLVFYEIATYLSNDMYLPGLPAITHDFDITQEVAQYTLLYWFLGSASVQLIVGPLSDRFGRKIVLLTGGFLYTTSLFVCAFTQNIFLFLIARFIQGSTVCSVVVAGYAAIHEFYDDKAAMRIIALMGSITILAPAFGPLLGGIVIEAVNWRAIFHFLGILGIISIALLFKVMPETNTNKISLHLKSIMKDYFYIATRKSFLSFTLPYCLLFMSFICWIVESPFIIIETYQKTVIEYGVIQLFIFAAYLVGAQITRRLIHKFDPLIVIKIGMLIALLSAGLLIVPPFLKENYLYFVVFSMMLMSLGSAIASAPLNRSAIDTCEEPMGMRVAIFSSYMSIFGVLATFLVTFFHGKSVEGLSQLIAIGIALSFAIFYLTAYFLKHYFHPHSH